AISPNTASVSRSPTMSSTHDWVNNPLDVVEEMFVAAQNDSASGWEPKVVEFFKNKLKEKNIHALVPSMNDVPLHYLKPNSLVKFRCLIQDMFDPEFYMGTYETVDPSTKAKVMRFGRYKDVTECGVDFNSKNTLTAERQTFYCVPIPGENAWVKEISLSSRLDQVSLLDTFTAMPVLAKPEWFPPPRMCRPDRSA
ncbi:unnamed protein product, partial [Tetraodon nigroviridis]